MATYVKVALLGNQWKQFYLNAVAGSGIRHEAAASFLFTALLLGFATVGCSRAEQRAIPADPGAGVKSAMPENLTAQIGSIPDATTCKAEGLLDHENTRPIPLVYSPGGGIRYRIQNDSANDDYFSLAINGYANGFFLVTPVSIARRGEEAWIAREHVRVFARNYSTSLTLHAQPRADSPPQAVVEDWWNGLYSVLRCDGAWLYVGATIDGQSYEGWMPPEMQCDNPYTTCN